MQVKGLQAPAALLLKQRWSYIPESHYTTPHLLSETKNILEGRRFQSSKYWIASITSEVKTGNAEQSKMPK